MEVISTKIPDVKVIQPRVFGDERGFFFESFNKKKLEEALNRPLNFVQDNVSSSKRGVLRGLHYQIRHAQGKLVQVLAGEVFDVALDIRRSSPTFGQWVGEILSAQNQKQFWVPEGFAHAFFVLSEIAVFHYKVTDYWYAEHERCIKFDDPAIKISWPTKSAGDTKPIAPVLSQKDAEGEFLKDADIFDI
ncbi:MAG: dTDP-4-dehydrorhamnose 3,5-epimerase [Pseudomonadota bacterium]